MKHKTKYCLTTKICALITAGLGFSALLGWILNRDVLYRFYAESIPMAPGTAVMFVLAGCSLFLYSFEHKFKPGNYLAVAAAIVVSLFALLLLIQFIAGFDIGLEGLMIHNTGTFHGVAVGRASPITAVCFLLFGTAFLLVLYPLSEWRLVQRIAFAMAVIVAAVGVTVVSGFLYWTPLFYSSEIIPMALPTAVGFISLGAGLMSFSILRQLILQDELSLPAKISSLTPRYLPEIVIMGLGIVLSFFIAVFLHKFEYKNVQTEFEQKAGALAVALQKNIEKDLEMLSSINAFYASSNEVTRLEFREFIKGLLPYHSGIRAIEWIPRVSGPMRAEYERSARKEGLADFRFTEKDAQGEIISAGHRKEYFPVYFVEPLRGNEKALGFDLASDLSRFEALMKARDTGMRVATSRIRLVQETARQYGFLVFQPVYRNGVPHDTLQQRRANLLGFALGVFRTGDLVEESLSKLNRSGIGISILDKTATPENNLVYIDAGANKPGRNGLHFTSQFDMADRQWSLEFHSTPAYISFHQTWHEVVIAVTVLIFTFFIVLYMLDMKRRSVELERSAEALRKSEEELKAVSAYNRRLFEIALAGIWIIDLLPLTEKDKDIDPCFFWHKQAGVKVVTNDVNNKICEMLGVTREEVIGRSIFDPIFVDEHNAGLFLKEILARREGKTGSYEFSFKHKDGHAVPALINAIPIGLDKETGKVVQAMGTITDLTERKKLEGEREKMRRLESVGILAGGIAHDFNNLLGAILGNIVFSRMSVSPADRIYDMLSEAEFACEKAKELSARLLTFSPGGAPVRERLSLIKVLEETVRESMSGSDSTCEFDLPDYLYDVYADERQLKQVIANMVFNAKDAMPGGGVLRVRGVNVGIAAKDNTDLSEGNYLRISIEDNGMGIPEEDIPRIFDPYFSTKQRGEQKGMGLGLAVCHSIIRKHDGMISVESKVGAGTTFHIYLPAYKK